jgi:quinoprotein glucose dehydrogenase
MEFSIAKPGRLLSTAGNLRTSVRPRLPTHITIKSVGIAVLLLQALGSPSIAEESAETWSAYGGDQGGTRYSPLTRIDRRNVGELTRAWSYRTGELGKGLARADKLAFEATPIFVDGVLYLSTPTNIVIALDAVTGRERWRYDPRIARNARYSEVTSRGVAYWREPGIAANKPCARRIFFGTLDARLIAIDAANGKPCMEFGLGGSVDLAPGAQAKTEGQYQVTSPPTVFMDLVITGAAIGDNRAAQSELGVVRAFDARTGALRWSFAPLKPRDGQIAGAANAWSVFSADPALGLIYVPTGSPSPDYFGGLRPGGNEYANSLVALRAKDGSVAWSQQLVHHDLWDYDLAAQPVLVDIERDGHSIAAVVQATKMGTLFVFERETGAPINEIIERPVPHSTIEDEAASITQPFTTTPPLVSQRAITSDDAWGLTFYDRAKCRNAISALRSEGMFTPPSQQGTIQSPGYAGGINWGSAAFDRERQVLITAVNHVPMTTRLIPRNSEYAKAEIDDDLERGRQEGTPYIVERGPLLSPFGLPCTAPPWGTLAAVDLQRNVVLWQRPLGSTKDFAPWFMPARDIGMPNMGGAIVTGGGLIFIGASTDNFLRAFDIATGKELWKGRLPAGGQATPMTYEANGRQYVVIAAGGHGPLGTKRGDYVVAFALPKKP